MIFEQDILKPLVANFKRSPVQENRFYQSDSEIIRLGKTKLAVTIDSMVEEIHLGIYKDPYEIGFVSFMSSISDLTASAAEIVGLLSTIELPESFDSKSVNQLFRGMQDACELNDTYVLGGDTNWSDRLRVGSVGIGKYEKNKPIMRTKIELGDKLFASGRFGGGNANAVNQLLLNGKVGENFLPSKVSHLNQLVSKYASAAIDTSDGFFMALSILGELNGIDFDLSVSTLELVQIESLKVIESAKLPPWYLLAGPVGEYQILFSVGQEKAGLLNSEVEKMGYEVFEIGSIVKRMSNESTLKLEKNHHRITSISNMVQACKGDVGKIINGLKNYEN